MMSATTELDPTILKALGYFRSNSVESAERLKAMLTEVVESSKRGFDSKTLQLPEKAALMSGRASKIAGNSGDFKKRENSSGLLLKRQYEKVQGSDEFGVDVKKSYIGGDTSSLLGSSSSKSSVDLLSSNGVFAKLPNVDASTSNDFELEMADLACAICKEMTIGSGNQLVECEDCHNLYHQDCHQPPVTDKDLSDPRIVWYCAKCQQSMKQESIILPSLPRSSVNSHDGSGEKSVKVKPKPTVTPFKRSEMKSSFSTSSNNSGAPLSGWAPLSGKPTLGSYKSYDESMKTSETKPDNLKKSTSQKEKPKTKNHSKNFLLGSDAWAEALGAKSSSNDKHKTSSKVTSNNNNAKHPMPSTASRLTSTSSGLASKQKSSSTLNSLPSHKAAPFPKSSASSGSLKSMSTADRANKQLQSMKKKSAAKFQQKRARI